MTVDSFLKIEGVEGETQDAKHHGEISLETFSFGAKNPSSISSGTTGAGTGRVSVSTFDILKRTDKSSPVLFQACCEGRHYAKATATVRKAGGTQLEYLVFEFTEVYVDSFHWEGPLSDPAGQGDLEKVSFSFGSVRVKYVPQRADGSGGAPIYGSWDLVHNCPK